VLENPELFQVLGISWTAAKCVAAASIFLFLASALLFAVLFKHTRGNRRWRRLVGQRRHGDKRLGRRAMLGQSPGATSPVHDQPAFTQRARQSLADLVRRGGRVLRDPQARPAHFRIDAVELVLARRQPAIEPRDRELWRETCPALRARRRDDVPGDDEVPDVPLATGDPTRPPLPVQATTVSPRSTQPRQPARRQRRSEGSSVAS
jgi:hypothetical protein